MINKDKILDVFNQFFRLGDHPEDGITVDDQGRVNVKASKLSYLGHHSQLPVKLGTVPDFVCYDSNLTSLEGFPEHVQGALDISTSNIHLKDLTGLPKIIDGPLFIICWEDTPLMRILQSQIQGSIYLYTPTDFSRDDEELHSHAPEVTEQLEEILNKYKNQGNRGILRAIAAIIEQSKYEWSKYNYDASINAKI